MAPGGAPHRRRPQMHGDAPMTDDAFPGSCAVVDLPLRSVGDWEGIASKLRGLTAEQSGAQAVVCLIRVIGSGGSGGSDGPSGSSGQDAHGTAEPDPAILAGIDASLHNPPFVTVCCLAADEPAAWHTRLIAACDYAFIPERSMIRWPVSAPLPGARCRRKANPLTVRLTPTQLEELGICRKYADIGAVDEFLKRLVDGLSGVSGRSVQILRLATRTGHGGHDLSRVPNSLAVRWHAGHA